jgi:hypothetical protein
LRKQLDARKLDVHWQVEAWYVDFRFSISDIDAIWWRQHRRYHDIFHDRRPGRLARFLNGGLSRECAQPASSFPHKPRALTCIALNSVTFIVPLILPLQPRSYPDPYLPNPYSQLHGLLPKIGNTFGNVVQACMAPISIVVKEEVVRGP